MDQSQIDILAKKIWDYMLMHQKLEKADIILVLGSHDLRVPAYAAKLALDKWAPLIIFSGKSGRLTKNLWNRSEAEMFAAIASQLGVPQERILIETQSTNTGDNILFVKKLLEEREINAKKFIVVQKPYMERRVYATFKKLWPEKDIIVTSPPIPYDHYPDEFRSKEDVINIIVGDLQRIKIYPEKGYQIPQEIPADVWDAYEKLQEAGYDQQVVSVP